MIKHGEAKCRCVLAAQLEDVPDLNAAGDLESFAATGTWIATVNFGGFDDAVGGEVAAHREMQHVLAVNVGAGDPR